MDKVKLYKLPATFFVIAGLSLLAVGILDGVTGLIALNSIIFFQKKCINGWSCH